MGSLKFDSVHKAIQCEPVDPDYFKTTIQRLFEHPERYGFTSSDEAAEVYIRHQARLQSIIKKSIKMEDGGKAYIDTCMRFLAKSIQRTNRKRDLRDFVLESSSGFCGRVVVQPSLSTEPVQLQGDEATFIGSISPAVFITRLNPSQRRLLYLTIKCAWEIDDELIEKMAWRLGLPPLWLGFILQQARASLDPARIRIAKLNERINSVWLRLRILEAQMKSENLSTEVRQKLWSTSEKYHKRYDSLKVKKEHSRLLVSNKAIADLLKVPKGSVDSGIFYLKAELKKNLVKNC